MDKQNIINLAAYQLLSKKPTKKECFSIVENMIESGHVPSEYELAKLYTYFMPSVPKKAKSAEDWIKKALPKSYDVRGWTNYIQVSDVHNLMFATDGYRLHVKKIPSIDPGTYDKAYNRVTRENLQFNWNNSFLQIINKTYENIKVFNVSDFETVKVGKYFAYKIKIDDENFIYINKAYLDDALNSETLFQMYWNEPDAQIKVETDYLESNKAFAIIMPIRGPKED